MNIQQTYSRSIKSVCSLCVVVNNRTLRTLSQKGRGGNKDRASGRHQMCTLPIKKRKESQKNKDEKTTGAQGRANIR